MVLKMKYYYKKLKRQVNKYHYKHNKYTNNILRKHPEVYIKKFIRRKLNNSCDFEFTPIGYINIEVNGIVEQVKYNGKIWFKTNDERFATILKRNELKFKVNNYDIEYGFPEPTSNYFIKDNQKIYTSYIC